MSVKRVPVDTNFNWLGPDKPALSLEEVEQFQLTVGEKVVAYQPGDDSDVWNATVRYDLSVPEQYRWYVELD
jgi:hypothetical protein